MESDSVVQTDVGAETEVMASVEEGSVAEFIIADISTDDAYLTVPLDHAASLPAWR